MIKTISKVCVVFSALMLSGCIGLDSFSSLNFLKKAPPPIVVAVGSLTQDELAVDVQKNWQGCESFEVLANLIIDDQEKGKKVRIKYLQFFSNPDLIRVRSSKLSATIFDFWILNGEFTGKVRSKEEVMVGQLTDMIDGIDSSYGLDVTKNSPIGRPLWLPPLGDGGEWKTLKDEYEVTYFQKNSDVVARMVWVDKVRPVVTQMEVYNETGGILARAKYDNFVNVKGVWFPKKLELSLPAKKKVLLMKVKRLKINHKIPAKVFEVPDFSREPKVKVELRKEDGKTTLETTPVNGKLKTIEE